MRLTIEQVQAADTFHAQHMPNKSHILKQVPQNVLHTSAAPAAQRQPDVGMTQYDELLTGVPV
jgi:hypothetical protein